MSVEKVSLRNEISQYEFASESNIQKHAEFLKFVLFQLCNSRYEIMDLVLLYDIKHSFLFYEVFSFILWYCSVRRQPMFLVPPPLLMVWYPQALLSEQRLFQVFVCFRCTENRHYYQLEQMHYLSAHLLLISILLHDVFATPILQR